MTAVLGLAEILRNLGFFLPPLHLRDVHPVPQIWSHYCKYGIVFSDWLIYLSGWILIRVEKSNSLLLNSKLFFFALPCLPAGCWLLWIFRLEPLFLPASPTLWLCLWWQGKALHPYYLMLTYNTSARYIQSLHTHFHPLFLPFTCTKYGKPRRRRFKNWSLC